MINRKLEYTCLDISFILHFYIKKIEGSINLYDLENSSYLKNIVLVGRVETIIYVVTKIKLGNVQIF